MFNYPARFQCWYEAALSNYIQFDYPWHQHKPMAIPSRLMEWSTRTNLKTKMSRMNYRKTLWWMIYSGRNVGFLFCSILLSFVFFPSWGGGGGGEEFFSRKTNSLKYTFYFFPDYFGFCCCCCWISILLSKPSVTWLYIVDDCRPCAAAAAVMSVATVPRLMMSTALPVIYGHSFQHFILCGACR